MSDSSRLDRVYAQLMCHHPYGWALFKKVTKRDIFPGSCGYFDADGDWRTLVDLNRRDDVVGQGWKPPGDEMQSVRSPESMTWGPKNSDSVKSSHVGGTIGASTVVAPVEASVSVLFENRSERGAVLTTESPVWRCEVGDERAAVQWMMDNKREMLDRHGDVFKRHGIWIVAKTYSTRRCAVAVLTAKSATVEIGLGADLQGVLTLSPKSAWTSTSGSSCMEMHEDDEDGVVVFISGVYFSPKLFTSGLNHIRDQSKQKGKLFRSGEDEAAAGSQDGHEGFELDMAFYPPLEDDAGSDSSRE